MELLTVLETAQLLKVNPITVRRYIAAGRLAAVKVGKGVRVPKESLEDMLTPVETKAESGATRSRRRAFSFDDPLWEIVGAAASKGPADIATRKHDYVADAYAAKGR